MPPDADPPPDAPPRLDYEPVRPPDGVDGRLVVLVMLAILGLLLLIGLA